MKRQQLIDAYDQICPDQTAKERMLQNILSQASDSLPAGKDVTMKGYLKKSTLIAAVITLALVLMGCAVVLMRLSDLQIAEESYTENAHYERNGTKVPAQEKSRTITSLQGIVGSKNQQAAQEWYEFEQGYDYEKIEDDYLAPEEYSAYPVYNAEMLQKVMEICEKYALLPAGRQILIQHYQDDVLLDLIGVERLIKAGKADRVDYYGSTLYACGNFDIAVEMELSEDSFQWQYPVTFSVNYKDKAYFDTGTVVLDSEAKQWNYTLSDGMELLIVKVDNCAWVFYDRKDAFLSARINTLHYDSGSEPEVMCDRDIELVTECIDFTLEPQKPELTGVEAKLEAAEKAYQEEQERIRATMPDVEPFSHDSYTAMLESIPEYRKLYAQMIRSEYTDFPENFQYVLMDMTGDGQDELILGKKGRVLTIWRMINGKTVDWSGSGDLYICEDGVIHQSEFLSGQPHHYYYRLGETAESEEICYIGYSKYDESWMYMDYAVDEFPNPISEESAMDIIDSYIHVDLEWKPINEFLMK